MTQEADKKGPGGPLADPEEILDWDDALDSWELELDAIATAEASPLHVQSSAPAVPSTQPPSPEAAAPLPPVPAPTVPPEPLVEALELGTSRPPPPPPTGARGVQPAARPSAPRPRMYQPLAPEEVARLTNAAKTTRPPPGDMAEIAFGDRHTAASAIPHELLDAAARAETSKRSSGPAQDSGTRRPVPHVPAPPEASVLEVVLESGELELEPPEPDTPERAAQRARVARLETLARATSGESAAELLVSAGELMEELDDEPAAEARYQQALGQAPRHLPALRALARLAFRAGDLTRYVQLLERVAELPLPRVERARLLTHLGLTRWLLQQDARAALEAAREASDLAPQLSAPALLRARIEASSQPAELDAALLPLAERTQDRALASMWLVSAGRAVELRDDLASARALYARAAADDPFAFDAQLSLARMEHAAGAHDEAGRALLRTLESFDIGPVAEAVRRRAAHLLGMSGAYAEAVELLEHASDDISLRTATQLAMQSGERALALRAAESWTLGTDGSERALALLTHAELLADGGDVEGAEGALELATLADPGQVLVSVAREALARRSGSPARLAEIVASEEAGRGALAAAAKLAIAGRTSSAELAWLLEAAEEESGIAAHLLAIDASAELARHEEQRRLRRTESERGTAGARMRALIALSDFEREHGEPALRCEALRAAVELAPRDAAALRAYARALPEPAERVQAYRREAESAIGTRAAFLYLREGHVLADHAAERLEALARAHEADPSYAAACWALHREARRQGDLARLSALHTREAERTQDIPARAGHLVRAALIRAAEDGEGAAEQLTRALALTPDDPVLGELVVRLGDSAPATTRAAVLERMATHVQEPFRRALVLAAAGTLEDDGRSEAAAERYRAVLQDAVDDPIANAGLERVLAKAPRGTELLDLRRRAVQEASTERARARALEELLPLEREPERALEAALELSALVPGHPLALRTLERDAMARDDRKALAALELQMLASTRGGSDKAARLRFVHLLQALTEEPESVTLELDRTVVGCAPWAHQSLWLTRQLMSSAVALDQRDLVVRAVELSGTQTGEPVELASLSVEQGWLMLDGAPERSEVLSEEALQAYPEHPTAHELLAEARRQRHDFEGAAEQFERAAERALDRERSAALWARAAELWSTEIKFPERARRALQRAAAKDLDYPGIRERLAELLTEQGDVDGLINLTSTLIEKGGQNDPLTELRRKLALLHEQRGDHEAARKALREALAQAPDNLGLWRDLARVSQRSGEHAERIEALTALTQRSRDPLELRDALLELGDIYERETVDLGRAESAYQRVLKLGPRNLTALERLAGIYRRQGKDELAIETLTQLTKHVTDPAQKRAVTLQLAEVREQQGDPRTAEELLEALRRSTPTDRELLRSLTGLLRRTNAHTALAMHLNRAVNDLRHALAGHFDDAELWSTIVEMLTERERFDVAGQCTATARALGLDSALPLEQSPRITEDESGIGAAALSELLDDLVFPEGSPPSLRILFRHAAETLNRVAPLDLRALGAERLDKRHPLRAVVATQARWVAHRDIEIYTSSELPYAFVPVQDAPIQLLVGQTLLEQLSHAEQQFLTARALKIARAQMSIACRLRPRDIELLLHALVRSQVATHAPPFIDAALLEETAQRVGKQLPRRAQSELVPHVLELTYGGMPRFDAASVYGVASTAGSRAGLLATGSIAAALSALVKLSGATPDAGAPSTSVAQVDEARELVSFSISEAYFEARERAGKDTR